VDKSGTSEHNEDVGGSGEVNELLQQLLEDWSAEADLQDEVHRSFFEVDIGDDCDRDGVLAGAQGTVDATSLPKPNVPICVETVSSNLDEVNLTDVTSEGNILNNLKAARELEVDSDGSSKARKFLCESKKVVKRTSSCPPERNCSRQSGP